MRDFDPRVLLDIFSEARLQSSSDVFFLCAYLATCIRAWFMGPRAKWLDLMTRRVPSGSTIRKNRCDIPSFDK